MSWWDQIYEITPPWDIGQPQPAFVELLKRGEVPHGALLDVGCGTGENAIFFAQHGFSVIGIDLAPTAIRLAKHKAKQQKVQVTFHTDNALNLTTRFPSTTFANVIDSGLFHTLTDEDRIHFINQLVQILHEAGHYFMLCFSEKEQRAGGPRRISKQEIRETLTPSFTINYIRDAIMLSNIHDPPVQAYFTSAKKL